MAKKIYEQKGTNLEVICTCDYCKEDCAVDMTYDQYRRLTMVQSRTGNAQDLLGDIPEDVRRIFDSSICPDCWKYGRVKEVANV